MNENYSHPSIPNNVEIKDLKKNIMRGMYLLRKGQLPKAKHEVVLLGSGTILREVLAAADLLESDHQINAHVFSVTSFNELRREALRVERENWLHPEAKPKISYVEEVLGAYDCPVIAATDYIKSYPDQIRAFIKNSYKVLGTDGFGRSDTRKNLREFFEVDKRYIVIAALSALAEQEKILPYKITKAIQHYQINVDKPYSLDE